PRREPRRSLFGLGRIQGEGHSPFDNDFPVDTADPLQLTHPAAESKDDRFDLDHIAGMDRPPVTNSADAGKERQALPVLRFGEDQDGPDLRDGLGQDRGGKNWNSVDVAGEIALVQRDVLDADNTFVDLELRDAVDKKKRVPVWQDAFDRRMVKRQRQIHVFHRLYCLGIGSSRRIVMSTSTRFLDKTAW